MEQKTIEGTWEEIAMRGDELAGRRVRLTVLDDLATPTGVSNGIHATAHERVSDSTFPEDLIDYDAIASCAREIEGQRIPSLTEVREALAKIPGSMAQAVIEDRDERF